MFRLQGETRRVADLRTRSATEPIKVEFEVFIRPCRKEDLRALEWEGLFRSHRAIIQAAFRNQERGRGMMLVADAGGIVVGQVWIKFRSQQDPEVATVWAMRVLPWFHKKGIGTVLLQQAERECFAHGYHTVELEVDQSNHTAQELYKREGYTVTNAFTDFEPYRTKTGREVQLKRPRFRMRKELTDWRRLEVGLDPELAAPAIA